MDGPIQTETNKLTGPNLEESIKAVGGGVGKR